MNSVIRVIQAVLGVRKLGDTCEIGLNSLVKLKSGIRVIEPVLGVGKLWVTSQVRYDSPAMLICYLVDGSSFLEVGKMEKNMSGKVEFSYLGDGSRFGGQESGNREW